MQLRRKLTLLYLTLFVSILLISFTAIYFWFAEYRKTEFYDRMHKKAMSITELLIDVEEVDNELLKKIDDTRPASLPEEKIVIYNHRNEKIYSNPVDDLVISHDVFKKIRLERRVEYIEAEYEVLGFYYTGKYDRVVVAIAAKDIYGFSKLYRLRVILIAVSLITVVLVFFSGQYFIGKALNPITSLIEQIDKITINNLNERLNEGNGKDELAHLARTFNKVMKRLDTSIQMQRIFIANASHELRTPLTVITGQLEVALMKERAPEAYKAVIQSVADDIIAVNQMANRLLLIAQATSNFASIEMSKIRIDDVIWEGAREIKRFHANYQINLTLAETIDDDTQLLIRGNLQLLKAAVTNLLENGCKYADNHRVDAHIRHENKKAVIEFKNNGKGIQPQELPYVFEPFYRGKNAQGQRGQGIGLSLVKNIIELHKGNIEVTSEPGTSTCFTIFLPCECEA